MALAGVVPFIHSILERMMAMNSEVAVNKDPIVLKEARRKELMGKIKKNKWIYLMLLPGILYFII